MTTITSPRPSFTSLAPTATPSSSRRPSLDTPLPSRSQNPSPSRPAFNQNPNLNPTRERRNRAALRDYYGLKNSSLGEGEKGKQEEGDADGGGEGKESELDAEGFDAEAYVRGVLGREGLEGVLRVEGGLVAEIKGLDGERKALVYDNYSKLITATDTIRKMRSNMDPLTPTTSTLTPAIAHIADTAAVIAKSLRHTTTSSDKPGALKSGLKEGAEGKRRQRATVRWVLDSPRRLRENIGKGERDAATKDWEEIRGLLDKWKGIEGVEQVRQQCEKALEGDSTHGNGDT